MEKRLQAEVAMGRTSIFYDVLNHVVIDSVIAPKGTPER